MCEEREREKDRDMGSLKASPTDVMLFLLCGHVPPALIRWLTSVQSGTEKGPLQPTIRLISRDSKQTSRSQQHRSMRTPSAVLNNTKRGVRKRNERGGLLRKWAGKGIFDGCPSINSPHITASDMHVGSCLLIMAQICTRRLLCHQVPGTICRLLCEKIGQTGAGHFPPNYPHLLVLLQAAWTGERGKRGERAKQKEK